MLFGKVRIPQELKDIATAGAVYLDSEGNEVRVLQAQAEFDLMGATVRRGDWAILRPNGDLVALDPVAFAVSYRQKFPKMSNMVCAPTGFNPSRRA